MLRLNGLPRNISINFDVFKNSQEIPDFLVPYWEMVEHAYMNTIKTILRCLRDEQHSVIYYLADIR